MRIFHEEHLLGASDVSHIRYGIALIIVVPELASAIFFCAIISLRCPQHLRIMIMKQFHETVSITLSNTCILPKALIQENVVLRRWMGALR